LRSLSAFIAKNILENKIEKIIEEVRPYIQMHGGDVELLDIAGGIVKLKVSGACVGCAMSHVTFDQMIGGMIREKIPEIKEIIIV